MTVSILRQRSQRIARWLRPTRVLRRRQTGSPPPKSEWCCSAPSSVDGLADSELLLQAGRRRRVLGHEPLVRINVAVRLLRHQRDLVEAGEDQLELARIGVDVADREDARDVGLELLSIDRNEIVVELDAPVRHRAELHGEPEEWQDRIAGDVEVRAIIR